MQGYRHFFTNKPVRKPDDLKGLRIRTPPAPIWQESIRALGATPVAMAFGEMYPGLQQKAIDGVELVYNNIPGGRFYEVLKYANETRHIMLINFEVVSAKWFDTLPQEYQQSLIEECDKAGEETSQRILQLEGEVKQQLKGRGMTVVEDVDLAAFRKAGEKAYEALKLTDVEERGAQGDRQADATCRDGGSACDAPYRAVPCALCARRCVGRRRFLRADGGADLPRRRQRAWSAIRSTGAPTPPPACSPGPASCAPTSRGGATA